MNFSGEERAIVLGCCWRVYLPVGLLCAASQPVSCSVTTCTTEVASSPQTKRTALCGMGWHKARGHQGLGHEQGVEVFRQCFGERRVGAGFNMIDLMGLPG